MDFLELVKQSFSILRRNKGLWLLGVFAAAGAGSFNVKGGWPAPWVLGLALVGIGVGAVLHSLAEAALISGVGLARDKAHVTLGESLRAGGPRMGAVLGVKLAQVGLMLPVVAIIASPALLLLVTRAYPLAVVLGCFALLLVSLPFTLTLALVAEYALRIAVLEGRGTKDALKAAYRFLHGRLKGSLKLLLTAFLAKVGTAMVAALALVPAGLLALAAYLASQRWEAALAAGLLVAVPVALLGAGAAGVMGSSVWTLGYLEQRGDGR